MNTVMMHRILIADDDIAHQKLINHALKSLEQSYEFIFANNGQEAYELTEKHHPCIVFWDQATPPGLANVTF